MRRFRKQLDAVVFVSLLLAPCALAWAQSASEHYPNDDGGANVQVAGTMELTLKAQGLAPIKASTALTVGESGQQVAVDGARALCLASVAAGMLCDDATCNYLVGASKSVTCTSGDVGYSITRLNTQVNFTVAPTDTDRIQALNCRTSSGNTHGDDLLERVLVRVDPNGVNGNVVFRVHHFQGGTNPRTFTVNTTGLTDDALHEAIASGYNNMGLGLTAVARPTGTCFVSPAPETLPGAYVNVTYSASTQTTLLDFEVDGLRSGSTVGQRITVETSGPAITSAAQCTIGDLAIGADKATLSWSYPAGCALPAVFDVVRAPLTCRCDGCTTCLANDGGSSIADGTTPAPGTGFWYLTRVSGGTWNGPGTRQEADYDSGTLAPTCVP